ncbi:MAG TPA: NHLP leader peptide family RiPP precursor [Thermoanaerobaculia bacterium]
MSDITRGEMLDIITEFAAKDPTYRAALLADPKALLAKQLNQVLPEGLNVKVVEETADTIYVIAPHVLHSGDELSDADLERVAGGKSGKGGTSENRNSYTCNDTVGIGTRVEITSIG